jgi:hypothetical protein
MLFEPPYTAAGEARRKARSGGHRTLGSVRQVSRVDVLSVGVVPYPEASERKEQALMPIIPSIMLKRLYVAGSLKNAGDGFQLAIRNTLAAGTIIGLGPVTVDGTKYDAGAITVEMLGTQRSASAITSDASLRFNMGTTAVVSVKADPLPQGAHEISIVTDTREAGKLVIPARDTI